MMINYVVDTVLLFDFQHTVLSIFKLQLLYNTTHMKRQGLIKEYDRVCIIIYIN